MDQRTCRAGLAGVGTGVAIRSDRVHSGQVDDRRFDVVPGALGELDLEGFIALERVDSPPYRLIRSTSLYFSVSVIAPVGQVLSHRITTIRLPRCFAGHSCGRTCRPKTTPLTTATDNMMAIARRPMEADGSVQITGASGWFRGMVRRTVTIEAVSITLEGFPDGLTQKQPQNHVKCRREYVPESLKILKAEKYITSVPYPERSNYPLWVSVKPYWHQADPLLTTGGNGPGEERSE